MKFERFKSKREKDMGKQIGKNRKKEKIKDKEKEEKRSGVAKYMKSKEHC